MTDRYGAKGCLCFYDEDACGASGRWMPNARCPHHGLLADFTDRRETGTYRVIKVEPEDRTVRPEPDDVPPGVDCEACAQYGECLDCQQAREEGEESEHQPVRCHPAFHCWAHCGGCGAEWPCQSALTEMEAVGPTGTPPWRREAEDPDVARAMLPPSAFGLDVPDAGPAECSWGRPFACRVHCPSTTEEETGVLAALRRWIRDRRA